MTRTDEELVASATAGDLDSFNQLVLRWERPIYALAYRVIGREEDARDVAQETFLRAFRALSGFKGQAKFSSWLYRITLNLCRDWIRRERRTPIAQAPEGVDLVELAGEAVDTESIEDLVSRKELGRAVAKAMAPARLRVLYLSIRGAVPMPSGLSVGGRRRTSPARAKSFETYGSGA